MTHMNMYVNIMIILFPSSGIFRNGKETTVKLSSGLHTQHTHVSCVRVIQKQ